jgi:hypothetical protein
MSDTSNTSAPAAPLYGAPLMPAIAAAYQNDPRRQLVNELAGIGQQALSRPMYSPWEALANALTGAAGGVADAYLGNQYQQMNKQAMQDFADAQKAGAGAAPTLDVNGNPVPGTGSAPDPTRTLAKLSQSPYWAPTVATMQMNAAGKALDPYNLRPGEQHFGPGNQLVASNTTPLTDIGKLIQARDALPPNDPNRGAYNAAITKLGTDNGFKLGQDANGNPTMAPIIGGPASPGYIYQKSNAEAQGRVVPESTIAQNRAAAEGNQARLTQQQKYGFEYGGDVTGTNPTAPGLQARGSIPPQSPISPNGVQQAPVTPPTNLPPSKQGQPESVPPNQQPQVPPRYLGSNLVKGNASAGNASAPGVSAPPAAPAPGANLLRQPTPSATPSAAAPATPTAQRPLPQGAGLTEPVPITHQAYGGGTYQTNLPPLSDQAPIPHTAKELDNAYASWQKTKDGWQSTLAPGYAAEQRLETIADAFKSFQSGSWSTDKADIAAKLKGLGIDVTPYLGDPAKVQLSLHENYVETMQQLKASNSRWTQFEFKALSANKENPDIQPAANLQMLSEDIGTLRQARDLPNDFVAAQRNGWRDPQSFETAWLKQNPVSGYVAQVKKEIGPLQGMQTQGASRPGGPSIQDIEAAIARKQQQAASAARPPNAVQSPAAPYAAPPVNTIGGGSF